MARNLKNRTHTIRTFDREEKAGVRISIEAVIYMCRLQNRAFDTPGSTSSSKYSLEAAALLIAKMTVS